MRCKFCGAPFIPGTSNCWACRAGLEGQGPLAGEPAGPAGESAPEAAPDEARGAGAGAVENPGPSPATAALDPCPACGASRAPELTQCWNCGTALDASQNAENGDGAQPSPGEDGYSPPWLRESWPAERPRSEHVNVALPRFESLEEIAADSPAPQRGYSALDSLGTEWDSARRSVGGSEFYVPPWVRDPGVLAPKRDAGVGVAERPASTRPAVSAPRPVPEKQGERKAARTKPERREPRIEEPPGTAAGLGAAPEADPTQRDAAQPARPPERSGKRSRFFVRAGHKAAQAAKESVPSPGPLAEPQEGPVEKAGPLRAAPKARAAEERVEPVLGPRVDADTDSEARVSPRPVEPSRERRRRIWFGAAMALLGAGIATVLFNQVPEIRSFFGATPPTEEAGSVSPPPRDPVPPVPQMQELSPLPNTPSHAATPPRTNGAPGRDAPPLAADMRLLGNAPTSERNTAPGGAASPATKPIREPDRVDPPVSEPVRKQEPAAPSVATAPARGGSVVYRESCAACHESGVGSAPSLHDVSGWTDRLAGGRDSLYASVLQRHVAMKRLGGKPRPSNEEVRQAVDYMSDRLIAASVARAEKRGYSIHHGPGRTAGDSSAGEGPRAPAATQSDWRSELRAEVAACESRPDNVQQGRCIEMARWKHCAPARWGRDPQCPMPTEPPGPGGDR